MGEEYLESFFGGPSYSDIMTDLLTCYTHTCMRKCHTQLSPSQYDGTKAHMIPSTLPSTRNDDILFTGR